LYKYGIHKKPFEVLVVDNNSTDKTGCIVERYKKNYSNLRYCVEGKVGLSHGRNRAIKEAKSEIIAYLDDDVIISDTYPDRLLWVLENYKFDCLGGMYFPWYANDKPKWIPEDFGKQEKLLNSIGVLEREYVAGLNMIFTKSILNKIGGFPVDFGMIGDAIGYGEDDSVQFEIRKLGGIVIFDPDLYVYHAVLERKQNLLWQIKSIFINSQTNFMIHRKDENFFSLSFYSIKSIIAALILRMPRGFIKLITNRKYHFQNYILYVITPVLSTMGRLKAYLFSDK